MAAFRRPSPFGGGGGGGRRPFRPQHSSEKHRINDRITARQVRVIGPEGEQLGVMSTYDGIRAAEEAGLDLVEVSPNSAPPVCRIMDYGRFKYREQKKEAEARKKRTEVVTKELRIRYQTDVGDIETKLKRARDFIGEGNKVKFSMRFRAREVTHSDLGRDRFDYLTQQLADVAKVEERTSLTGMTMHIVFAPLTTAK